MMNIHQERTRVAAHTAGQRSSGPEVRQWWIRALVMMLEQLATLGTFAWLIVRARIRRVVVPDDGRHPLAA
jgi:hypothetical protein